MTGTNKKLEQRSGGQKRWILSFLLWYRHSLFLWELAMLADIPTFAAGQARIADISLYLE